MLAASLLCSLHLAIVPAPNVELSTFAADSADARYRLIDTSAIAPEFVVTGVTGTAMAGTPHNTDTTAPAGSIDTVTARPLADTAVGSADTAFVDRAPIAVDPLPGPFDMLTNLPDDWYTWGRETFTLDNTPIIGGMAALTAGLVVTDYESWQPFKKVYEQSTTFRDLSDAFVFVGDGKFQFGLAALFATYGFLTSNTTALRTASQTVEVILACGTLVQVLKHTTGRESPFAATTPTGRWALFPNQIDYHKHVPHYDAFPSGHIATAMATLTVIMENYPEQNWIGYIGYPAVAMVGIGLVATSIHWWSDIPLGLALGYQFGKLVSRHNRADASSAGGPQLGISSFSDGSPALSLNWRW